MKKKWAVFNQDRALGDLEIDPQKPLLVLDVDGVVLQFWPQFWKMLEKRNLKRNAVQSGPFLFNIVDALTLKPVSWDRLSKLVDEFFLTEINRQIPIAGAVASIQLLSKDMEIVFLTNVPNFAVEQRQLALGNIGLDFFCIANDGPKTQALKALAERTKKPLCFVDDTPSQLRPLSNENFVDLIVHFCEPDHQIERLPQLDEIVRVENWPQLVSIIQCKLLS